MTQTLHQENTREAREADARGITKEQLAILQSQHEKPAHQSATEASRFRDAVAEGVTLSEDLAEQIWPDVKAAMVEHQGRTSPTPVIQKS